MLIVAGLAGAGFLVGMLFGFLAAASCAKNAEDLGSLGAVIAWTIAGFPVGIALGLLVFRKVFKVGGSLVFGSAGGVVGVLLLLLLAEPLHLNIYTDALVIVFVLVPPALATAGYFYKILWPKKKISTSV